jgi:Flp pilus assembly pilin Flp
MRKFINSTKTALANISSDRSGAGALEYALLCSFIAALIIVGATAFGTALGAYFNAFALTVGGFHSH